MFESLLQLAKPLVSKNTWEKVSVCTASRPWGEAEISRCPFVAENVSLESLPSYLGGSCSCEGGCVKGFPNEMTKKT